ncbi:MAG: YfhO family protein [Muribaculaceae bacterium]|nr:YfhO family protein [Muribaculaceae bacterium]
MKKLLLLIIAVLTVGLLPVWFDFGYNWANMDFATQQIPFLLETKRMLASGTPWWSWNTFLGENFIGAYAFYTITSPFVWLICLFPAKYILWGVLCSVYLKTICTGLAVFLYFRKMDFVENLCILGSLMYCFSSFFIGSLFYFHFCEPMMMFPLLLIAEEKVVHRDHRAYLWLALAVFGVIFVNFYFALSSIILGALYFFVRAASEKVLNFGVFIRSVGGVFLGVLMASVVLFPVVCHHLGSYSANTFFYLDYRLNALLSSVLCDLRLLVMPDISEEPFPGFYLTPEWKSKEAFLVVFGLFSTIIYISKRRNWLTVLLAILIIMYFTPLNGLFTGFTNVHYSRWIYGLNIMMILTVMYLAKDNICVRPRDCMLYVAGVFVVVVCNYILDFRMGLKSGSVSLFTPRKVVETLLVAINCLCLFIWTLKPRRVRGLVLMICLCGGLNLGASVWFLTKNGGLSMAGEDFIHRELFTEEFDGGATTMNGCRVDALTNYRNYALLKNIPGIYGFHSSMDKRLEKIKKLVQDDYGSQHFTPDRLRESLGVLCSVGEIRDFRDSLIRGTRYEGGLVFEGKHGGYDEYSPTNFISMGFTYDSYILESELTAVPDSVDKIAKMMENVVIKSEDEAVLSHYLVKGDADVSVDINEATRHRRVRTVREFAGDSRGFSCRADFDSTEFVFFSVVADPGFTAFVDGVPTRFYEVNLGMIGMIVPPGKHKIEFNYFPVGLNFGFWVSFVSFLFWGILWWQQRTCK